MYAEGNPAELVTQAAGGADGATADDLEAQPLVDQVLDKIREAMRGADTAQELRITAEDVAVWAEIGERCKRIQHYYKEMEKEEDRVFELVKDTPLAYSWSKVKDLATASQKSCKSQGEQPPTSVDGRPDDE